MNIKIDDKILKLTPNFRVGVVTFDVEVFDNIEIDKLVSDSEDYINQTIDIKAVVNLAIIKDGRDAYKKYGKDPSRYRLAVESLYRRLSKGNKLYRINNVVDIGNILSLKTRKSIAVLDKEQIQGDILIRLGLKEDVYEGLCRGLLNIENIPLYEDNISPFGSVTSDTLRTSITKDTTKVLLFIISFSETVNLKMDIEQTIEIYKTYCKGSNFESFIL
ncbi:MAG: phenylalanine--tRNA ligase beta subunit-related protein [Candidatus Izemoplasma sp.]